MEGEEKGKVGVVGVEQIQGPEVESVVAGNCREECVQKVVFFFVELGVVNTEDFVELGARPVHLGQVQVVDDDGERKLAEVVAVEFDLLDALAEFPNLGFFRIVEQHILRRRVVQVDLAEERALGVVKVAALGLDDPAGLAGIFFLPFGHDVIVGLDFEQALEDQRESSARKVL